LGLAPIRLVVLCGAVVAGVLPLAAGLRRLTATEGAAVVVEIIDWDVRAGALAGPGDALSRLQLGWRRANAAHSVFTAPPLHPRVAERMPPYERWDSDIGPPLTTLELHLDPGAFSDLLPKRFAPEISSLVQAGSPRFAEPEFPVEFLPQHGFWR
jgi:hypothetical protein